MEQRPYFKRIYLEITNMCNQSCPFCPQTTRSSQFLALEDFQLILAKLQGHTKHLYLHVLGEPLLHPNLAQFLDEAEREGYLVNLVTNGALIGEVGVKLLEKRALRQISFSLHSLAHQGERKTKERLREVLKFVDQASARSSIYCSLRLWTGGIEANQVVIEEIKEHFTLNFDLGTELQKSMGRGLTLRERVFLNPAEEFVWPSLDAPRQTGRAFCHALTQQMAILVDGTVVPCCLDGEGVLKLGNIYEQDLGEIYFSPRAQSILQGFTQGQAVEELCQRCDYRTRFSKMQ